MKESFANRLGDFMDKSQVFYISSIDEDGFPNTKALYSIRGREGIDCFYFSSNSDSVHSHQLLNNSKACAYFCDPRYVKGLMIRGTVEEITDVEFKKSLVREGDSLYFAKGAEDEAFTLFKFNMLDGRLYNNFRSESVDFKE